MTLESNEITHSQNRWSVNFYGPDYLVLAKYVSPVTLSYQKLQIKTKKKKKKNYKLATGQGETR